MSLFHYTDIHAIQSILTNREFWFTHINFMNDKEELKTGLAEIVSWLEIYELVGYPDASKNRAFDFINSQFQDSAAIQDSGYALFSCSFSCSGNSLSQWRAYGRFAIELDRSVLSDGFDLYDCVYTKDEKSAAAHLLGNDVLEKIASDISADGSIGPNGLAEYGRLLVEAAKFKNAHFGEEQEVRAVSPEELNSDVSFRAKSDYLVPYVKKKFDIKAIKAVHVGPTPNQEMSERSLEALLISLDLADIPVVASHIPFRS
ncbi:DUF2971 domain-containing protein [Pseudomonas sp. 10S4]|uniref:DUF2971 domain-containing protein n=2 Tax=Pseudomonas sp. 10S4 TaxID=3048583 RepID=UPI002AC90729|nr:MULTISPECIES: DUF2971 domain-containing protein [unclassified Pseudomonas]MEB0226299.1 DUF2971 domain-containing protein [Pseudomonas sp. 5S1]WPX18173.1 DUF2971 domain-containing protein [Pseudomonas sp. 10S4]